MKTVSVIGLGKLGAPMVAVFASKGYRVIGVDTNQASVAALRAGKTPVRETGLREMLWKHRARITATTDFRDAVHGSDISFIIVPTPSRKDGGFDTSYAAAAARSIGAALRGKRGYHVVVLTSTVLPQASERDIIPVLENASGMKAGRDFGFCYNPEFIALGSVIDDLLHPDFILVGEGNRRAGSILEAFYRRLHQAPIRRMSVVNAELAKIAVNAYVTKKISFANMLAQICDRLPGGNVDVITAAIGSDARIGSKYLKGGLGFGGPCFPRDNRAFSLVARRAGANHRFPIATDTHNAHHLAFVVGKVARVTPKGGKIAILGITYKPDTGVTEESHALALAHALARRGFRVTYYDPASPRLPKGPRLIKAASLSSAVQGSSTVCIATPWDLFRGLKPVQLPSRAVVIDFWRALNPKDFPAHRIEQMGINP